MLSVNAINVLNQATAINYFPTELFQGSGDRHRRVDVLRRRRYAGADRGPTAGAEIPGS